MDINNFLTAEQWAKETFLFREYVLPNWLGIVFRGSKFSRFLYPSTSNRMPKIGREKVIGYLNLETVYLPFKITNALTKDGYLFQVSGKIAYIYDPSISDQIENHIDYVIKSLDSRKPVQDRILAIFTQQLRLMIGYKTACELMDGSISARIERTLSRTLSRELKDFGAKIDPHTGIIIDDLTPPLAVQEAHEKGLSHLLEVASGLGKLTEEQLQKLLQIKMFENGNMTFFVGGNENGSMGNFIPFPSSAQITPSPSAARRQVH